MDSEIELAPGGLPAPVAFKTFLDGVRNLALEMSDRIPTIEDPDALVRGYVLVQRLRSDMGLIQTDIAAQVHKVCPKEIPPGARKPKQILQVEGVGHVECATSGSEKWKQDEVLRAAATEIVHSLSTNEDGDIDEHAQQIAADAIGRFWALISPPAWRKTELRNIGIDPYDFVETGTRKPTLIVRTTVPK